MPRKRVTGVVASIDANMGTLTLKAAGKQLGLTSVTKAATDALGKFKAGDRVRVLYTEADGKLLALAVEEAKAVRKPEKIRKQKTQQEKKPT